VCARVHTHNRVAIDVQRTPKVYTRLNSTLTTTRGAINRKSPPPLLLLRLHQSPNTSISPETLNAVGFALALLCQRLAMQNWMAERLPGCFVYTRKRSMIVGVRRFANHSESNTPRNLQDEQSFTANPHVRAAAADMPMRGASLQHESHGNCDSVAPQEIAAFRDRKIAMHAADSIVMVRKGVQHSLILR
jgi:hypothetical protein